MNFTTLSPEKNENLIKLSKGPMVGYEIVEHYTTSLREKTTPIGTRTQTHRPTTYISEANQLRLSPTKVQSKTLQYESVMSISMSLSQISNDSRHKSSLIFQNEGLTEEVMNQKERLDPNKDFKKGISRLKTITPNRVKEGAYSKQKTTK